MLGGEHANRGAPHAWQIKTMLCDGVKLSTCRPKAPIKQKCGIDWLGSRCPSLGRLWQRRLIPVADSGRPFVRGSSLACAEREALRERWKSSVRETLRTTL